MHTTVTNGVLTEERFVTEERENLRVSKIADLEVLSPLDGRGGTEEEGQKESRK